MSREGVPFPVRHGLASIPLPMSPQKSIGHSAHGSAMTIPDTPGEVVIDSGAENEDRPAHPQGTMLFLRPLAQLDVLEASPVSQCIGETLSPCPGSRHMSLLGQVPDWRLMVFATRRSPCYSLSHLCQDLRCVSTNQRVTNPCLIA